MTLAPIKQIKLVTLQKFRINSNMTGDFQKEQPAYIGVCTCDKGNKYTYIFYNLYYEKEYKNII